MQHAIFLFKIKELCGGKVGSPVKDSSGRTNLILFGINIINHAIKMFSCQVFCSRVSGLLALKVHDLMSCKHENKINYHFKHFCDAYQYVSQN
jgi:hypothetical protein